MSNPARARASAARGGAVKAAPESSTWPVSAAIGLSRFPKVMSAFRNVSSSRRNEYSVSPAISRSRAVRRPRLMSPTAYRRSVPRAGGACATASSMLHATRRFRVIAVESQRTCAPPSTVDQPREHFRRVDEAGPRPGSICVAVEKLDAPVEQCPRVAVRDQGQLVARPLHVEPARRDDHEIGRQGAELPPGARHGWRARNTGDVLAPGDLDQLGDPVPRDVRRVEPFQNHDPGRRRTGQGSLPHAPQAVGEARDQLVRFVAQLHGLADLADVDEHLDERVRVQRHDPGGDTERGDDVGELLLAHRTDVADRLSDDDVRTQAADQLHVHVDGGGTLALRRRQRGVDLAGGEPGVEAGTGHARQATYLGWIVALGGHADEAPERPQGGHDLGGGGQERNDPHRYPRQARMPKCRGAACGAPTVRGPLTARAGPPSRAALPAVRRARTRGYWSGADPPAR